MENWNPAIEITEGALCGKGLMKETYDMDKNDLVRNLTDEGRNVCEELINTPEGLAEYLKMAQKHFSQFSKETQKQLWKNLKTQIEILRRKK